MYPGIAILKNLAAMSMNFRNKVESCAYLPPEERKEAKKNLELTRHAWILINHSWRQHETKEVLCDLREKMDPSSERDKISRMIDVLNNENEGWHFDKYGRLTCKRGLLR